MFFNIDCYIFNIQDNNVYITINNLDTLNRFINNLKKLYKNDEYVNSLKNKNIYKLKLHKNTKFDINFNYSNISELIGCEVIISASSKYYCFLYDSDVFDEQTNLIKIVKKIKKGYILNINKIKKL